jgi:hypothetical protein
MSQSSRLSPRHEALNAILQARQAHLGPAIHPDTWDKIVGIAWDNRTLAGDRREIQRELRQVLLEASRTEGGSDAAS